MFAEWRPAVVLSHDGRRLYIVHADQERLTTVDFDALTVRSIVLRETQSWLERLLDLTAGVAEAKGIWTGTVKAAVLSPDGKRLYVVGRTTTVTRDADGNRESMETHLGLQVIDLVGGHKVMSRDIELAGTWISADRIRFTPNGKHLLVGGWRDGGGWTEVLDAKRLERVADLPGWEVALTRRMDGQPVLLARRWDRERRAFEFAVLDPQSFDVAASWGETDAWWVTMP